MNTTLNFARKDIRLPCSRWLRNGSGTKSLTRRRWGNSAKLQVVRAPTLQEPTPQLHISMPVVSHQAACSPTSLKNVALALEKTHSGVCQEWDDNDTEDL